MDDVSTSTHAVLPLSRPPDVSLSLPGSKSHTNRALICAALANGTSRLGRVLFADDTEAMMGAVRDLGVGLEVEPGSTTVQVHGPPAHLVADTADSRRTIDVRKSGTTSRFLLPLLAATPGRFVLDGHDQLRARPFGPQLDALRHLGADIEGEGLPLSIDGRAMDGGTVSVSSSISSQYLSGLLLSAPRMVGPTTIVVDGPLVSRPYIDLTVATMAAFGVQVQTETGPVTGPLTDAGTDPGTDVERYVVDGTYQPADVELEPDASAASYFFAAAAITGGRVRVEGLGPSTVQGDLRFVDVLAKMGAEVTSGPDWTEVTGTGTLRGVTVDMADISDTAQTLAVVAAFADSPTVMDNIGFIRHKETDRIGAVVTELNKLGVVASETEDGMVINPGTPRPGLVHTYEDHRMAMSFSLLGLVHPGIEIDDPGCVDKTFPTFFSVLDRLR